MLKGALHVHSTYSDGEFTLAELRDLYLAEGCRFVCMTDHAEAFDEHSLRRYQEQCEALSDDKLLFVAGLEYECERRMHILGYGASSLVHSQDPEQVIRHIDSQGAVSVIAHPKDEFFSWIESFRSLPRGIEVWNTKYDGRYAPRPGTFALVKLLATRQPGLRAFYGQDLHWKKQYRRMFIELHADCPTPQSILAALSAGAFSGRKDDLRLSSSGDLPVELLAEFEQVHQRSARMRRFLTDGKHYLDEIGIRVPESWKSQLRRLF